MQPPYIIKKVRVCQRRRIRVYFIYFLNSSSAIEFTSNFRGNTNSHRIDLNNFFHKLLLGARSGFSNVPGPQKQANNRKMSEQKLLRLLSLKFIPSFRKILLNKQPFCNTFFVTLVSASAHAKAGRH